MSERLVAVFSPFENLTDPRSERTRRHELFDLVVVALCGTIAGADTWTDIERFGRASGLAAHVFAIGWWYPFS